MSDLVLSASKSGSSVRPSWLGGLDIPDTLANLFAPEPYGGVSAARGFERCVIGFAKSLQPRDAVEWIMVKDLADLQSDIDRARRAIVVHLSRSEQASITAIISLGTGFYGEDLEVVPDPDIAATADAVIAGDADAKAEFDAICEDNFLWDNPIGDMAFVTQSRVVEQLEASISRAMACRDRILAELDWRRSGRRNDAHPLQRKIAAHIDAEFTAKAGEP